MDTKTIQTIRQLMEKIIPGLPPTDKYTILSDLCFDDFCKELLSRDLEQEYTILIPALETDHWNTVGDIVDTGEKYTRD